MHLTSPQPLGVFGHPAGLLLIPSEYDEVRAALVAGRVPDEWPDELAGHRLVHEDRLDEALTAFAGEHPLDRYHRWLIDPSTDDAAEVRASLPAPWTAMVDVALASAHAAPSFGDLDADDGAHPPELVAIIHAARASLAAANGDHAAAIAEMSQASDRASSGDCHVLAAILRATLGSLLHDGGQAREAGALIATALRVLHDTDLRDVCAELLYRLGSISQEQAALGAGDSRTLLNEAMSHYYDALQLVSEQSAPILWANLQLNLAAAHLSTPMTQASDQLRLGVAMQALRACRRVFTPQFHPGPWSTATTNLASALVYLPSTHREENLVEAVELYEEVITSGVRTHDRLGRARLLTNQGNALAHLGAFEDARSRLVEARSLFEEALDHEGVMTVREILGEISKASVVDPTDDLDDLARQAEQLSRMPQPDGPRTAGMGVRIEAAGLDAMPPPKPRITIVPRSTRPTGEDER